MLVLPNVTMTPLNVRKNKEPSNASKVRSYVMLVLPNMIMVRCYVGTTQCDNGTFKCEKKMRVPPNVTKAWSDMVLILPNVTMKLFNVRKKIMVPPNVTKVQS